MKTRGRIALFVLLFALSLLPAGCFGWGASTPAPTPVEIQLASFPGSNPWTRAEDAVIEQFAEAHPHIQVRRQGYQQSVGETLANTPPPDIMLTATMYPLYQAMAQGQILDVTELWERSGIAQSYPAAFHRLSQQEGKQYFVPIGYPWSAIYYNRELFHELDLTPPQTWDEFLLLCEQLRNFGITPLSLAGNDPTVAMLWFEYLNLRLHGAEFQRQLMRGDVSFEDFRVLETLETWRTLFANDYFLERPAAVNHLDSMMALVRSEQGPASERQAAMILTHSGMLVDLPAPFQAQLDFFRFPILDAALPVAEAFIVYGYMIPQAADEAEAALTFLEHMASAEAQTLVAANLNSGTVVYAPTNLAQDLDALPAALRQGMEIVAGAEDTVPFFMFNLPDDMAREVAMAMQSWLRQPDNVLDFALAMERARQRALVQGSLTP